MKIACIGYRKWSLKIYDFLKEKTNHDFLIIRSKKEYDKSKIYNFKPDLVLFYGWSWIIEQEMINKYKCVMLHPSPLPKYRGGSPIQNQIINGEETGAVTLFIMDEGIDTGNIIAQAPMSLSGNILDIFDRMSDIGSKLTLDIIENGYIEKQQDHTQATSFYRRKKSQSEITITDLENLTGQQLYNKIRMLGDPYPNAFIRTKDGKKLLIKMAKLGE